VDFTRRHVAKIIGKSDVDASEATSSG